MSSDSAVIKCCENCRKIIDPDLCIYAHQMLSVRDHKFSIDCYYQTLAEDVTIEDVEPLNQDLADCWIWTTSAILMWVIMDSSDINVAYEAAVTEYRLFERSLIISDSDLAAQAIVSFDCGNILVAEFIIESERLRSKAGVGIREAELKFHIKLVDAAHQYLKEHSE